MSVIKEVENFYLSFNGKKGIIGKSLFNKPIYYIAVEKTKRPVIIAQYAIHAREYITSYLSLKQIEEFMRFGTCGTVYFIPMLNPDGVKIALTKNPLYKANGRGVDLNVNFDANWAKGAKNCFTKGAENFVGKYPFSEPESRAIRDFTLKIKPDMTVSYHSKGEEIYYQFFQNKRAEKRDYNLAKEISRVTGYKIKDTPFSCGGYKDWCIQKLKIPAVTIEVGDDNLVHPLKKECAKEIFDKNRQVLAVLTNRLWEILCN